MLECEGCRGLGLGSLKMLGVVQCGSAWEFSILDVERLRAGNPKVEGWCGIQVNSMIKL